jgi:uncharacterized protein
MDFLTKQHHADTKIIFVGDALMNPYELFYQTDYDWFNVRSHKNTKKMTGLERLRALKSHFSRIIWLNPESKSLWNEPTIDAIESEVPMFFLSIDGIQEGIRYLMSG